LGPINGRSYTMTVLDYENAAICMWELDGEVVTLEIGPNVPEAQGSTCLSNLNNWVTSNGMKVDYTSEGKTFALMQKLVAKGTASAV